MSNSVDGHRVAKRALWLDNLEAAAQPMAVSAGGRYLWTNHAYRALLDRTSEQMLAETVGAWLAAGDAALLARAVGRLSASEPSMSVEVRIVRPGGELRCVEFVVTRLDGDSGEKGSVLLAGWDLTAERETQQQLRHHATHDTVTGLPTRALFLEHLHHALARLDRLPAACASVLFIDLDRLKHVNDAYGHAAGDQLLAAVAERLRHAVRPQDVVARLGGDEFTVLLEDTSDRGQAVAIAERCLTLIADDYPIAGSTVNVTASIGIAAAGAGAVAADVLGQADAAMYRAKANGRNRIEFPDNPQPLHLGARAALERQLAGALERGELRVYYQPIVDLADGSVTAGEALLRWVHPEHGLLTAGEFIDIAEEAGFIRRIGEWVCDTVTADLAAWDRNGTPVGQVYLNIAAQQLADGTFVNHLARSLRRHALSAHRVCLEITETEIMSSRSTLEHLHALHELGCPLVVDDFGTGYSSLSRLIDLPVDTVKIDRSFIAGVGLDPRPTAVVSATLLLAHDLRQGSIAEGVETAQQHRWLIEAGCTHAQGFLLGAPQPAEAFIDLTTRTNNRPPAP